MVWKSPAGHRDTSENVAEELGLGGLAWPH